MREFLIEELKKEVVGPGVKANPGSDIPYTDHATGEEILLKGVHISNSPIDRYGAGILFPQEVTQEDVEKENGDDNNSQQGEENDNQQTQEAEREEVDENNRAVENEADDDDVVSMANQLKPAAMGLTIKCKKLGRLQLNISSARYEKGTGTKPKLHYDKQGSIIESNYECEYYIRRPILINPITIELQEITLKGIFKKEIIYYHEGMEWLQLIITNRSSSTDIQEGNLILTFTIVNVRKGNVSQNSLFQNEILISAPDNKTICTYREKNLGGDTELAELNLLYRKKKMFGVGHGCAAVWEESDNEFIRKIKTSVLPEYEIPLIAAKDSDSLAMFNLSDCKTADWESGKQALKNLRDQYLKWINEVQAEVSEWTGNHMLQHYIPAAEANIIKCKKNYERIEKGVRLLTEGIPNKHLVKCFRWMNRAMLWQQQRSKINLRSWVREEGSNQIILKKYEIISLENFHAIGKGRWRPFQLAFILMNIEAVWNEHSVDRKILDLIWFPTGGGKTEAYLGLSAFQIFTRRIKAVTDGSHDYQKYSGTTILMRYTLRLLTVQQYERASSLICACEIIRNENQFELGVDKISIGLWVGGNSTPNNNKGNENNGAVYHFNSISEDNNEPYVFMVMKCPCCGAQIGKLNEDVFTETVKTKGLKKVGNGNDERVVFKCENENCDTNCLNWDELPLYVVDEDIFKIKPTLVIGTVDKFAMLTWKAGEYAAKNEYDYLQAGTLFGFRYDHNKDYNKRVSRILPPELIIQDELHLIAGPLGTIVGLYETMIQTLCNNYKITLPPFIHTKDFIPPKIIASSATISKAGEQIRNLYGIKQEHLNIFPPQGIEFGETWFSNVVDIKIQPGRKYVGVLAPGYKSIQTAETRVYSRLLEAGNKSNYNELEKNYYWTIIGYFNSIRGLGSASTLINSDIIQYIKTLCNRELIRKDERRFPKFYTELTSRMSDSEIPRILKRLEEKYNNIDNKALDICLATNMIATGVDVSRLGLMVVHGQPKTTAEYIQASSRVGRELKNLHENSSQYTGQGLVVTIYSPTKPRDKSHYEQFQSYHSRIYANVEPTSVTPFSVNSRERALHAVFIGLLRQLSHDSLRHKPEQGESFNLLSSLIKKILTDRANIIDELEEQNVKNKLEELIQNFQNTAVSSYGDPGNYTVLKNPAISILLYAASAELPSSIDTSRFFPLKTNTSMRGVDSESYVKIYNP